MDPKAWLDFGLGALQALAWPVIVIVGICLFRAEIRALLNNITSAKAWGIEANFLERELEDPQNSEEVKDAFAQLWRDVATVKGQPVPLPAAEQLTASMRRRGRPVSPAALDALDDQEYLTQVKAALSRVSDNRIKFGFEEAAFIAGEVVVTDFTLHAEHGAVSRSILVRPKPAEDEFLMRLKDNPPKEALTDVLVVTRTPFDLPSIKTVCWRSEGDDERLADALEDAELFDYIEGER